jgi:aminoglycoside/choline kinase family phosphotransferase
VVRWALDFRRQVMAEGLPAGDDDAQFLRWFDLMGMQRHLKASGIFARLWHRDGKPGYLPDVPRTLGYIVHACSRHAELSALGALVSERVLPAVQASLGAGRA